MCKIKPCFSIIVLNWDGKKWLKKCFDSLNDQTCKDFEVIMTDNGSTDDSLEFTRKNYPSIRIFENGENLGYTGANNAAAKIAQGQYLIFLNNDTWLEEDFLENLETRIKDTQAKLVQAMMLPYNEMDRAKRLPWAGLDRFSYPAVMDNPFYVDGCCLIVEAALFEKLGGFDSRYFIFLEDVDLSWRAQITGEKVFKCETSVVHHECGATVTGSMDNKGHSRHKTSYFRRHLAERNSLSNVIKNYEMQNLLWAVPLHLCFGFGEALLYVASGKFKAAHAILRAIFWNFINIESTLDERAKIQDLRAVPDEVLFDRMIKGIGKLRAFRDVGGVPDFA